MGAAHSSRTGRGDVINLYTSLRPREAVTQGHSSAVIHFAGRTGRQAPLLSPRCPILELSRRAGKETSSTNPVVSREDRKVPPAAVCRRQQSLLRPDLQTPPPRIPPTVSWSLSLLEMGGMGKRRVLLPGGVFSSRPKQPVPLLGAVRPSRLLLLFSCSRPSSCRETDGIYLDYEVT